MRGISDGALTGICVSLFQVSALIVTYVNLTRSVSDSDESGDDGACVPFIQVLRLFTVIQALNSSFYIACIIFLNRIQAMITERVDADSGCEVKPPV